jgi:DNA replication protein DnaC
MLTLKQESAVDNTAPAVEDIIRHFQAMSLPRLSDANLYLGVPLPVLENFRQALNCQRQDDERKRFANRLRYAGIVRERTSDAFSWDESAYPLAEPGVFESALSIEFFRQHKNLIVVGPPGAGKSLLATVIACKVIWAGFSVKYKTAHDIATQLKEAKAGNSLSGYIRKLQACDMLVIEDVVFATFDKNSAQSFFSMIDGRYGRKTTVITSNGNINEWAAGFPDKRMSAALLGRFYEDAVLINMNGAQDMRLKHAKGMPENTDKIPPAQNGE